MKLFSGTANLKLSQQVASNLKIKLAESEVIRFANSEVRVRIIDKIKNQICVIIQATSNPTDTNLMELFFYADAFRRLESKKVIGIIPYFGYARQDIQHRRGECVSVNVIIRFLETIGFHKIYTVDLHDEATEGVFSIPFRNLSALPILANTIRKHLGENTSQTMIVSPDQGGIERARKFGNYFYQRENFELAVIEKKRDQEVIHQSKALALHGDVKGKIVIIVDDLTTSAGTLINGANICLKEGAKNVLTTVVHHDFSEDAPKKIQNSAIEKFFTTDTIFLKDNQIFPKLELVSVAPLIAEELKEINQD